MGKEWSQRLAELIEKVRDSHAEFEGQDAKFEYVFYPRDREEPATRYLTADDWFDFDSITSPPTIQSYYTGRKRLPPHCQLKSVVEGCEGQSSGSVVEFGLVEVYFIGSEKVVERLRELSALVGRFIPDAWMESLNQYVSTDEKARTRARCLAWLGRLWFIHSEEGRRVTESSDASGRYYVGEIDDAFSQLELLLRLLATLEEAPEETSTDGIPWERFFSVDVREPVEGLAASQVIVTQPSDLAQLPDHGGVIVEPQFGVQAVGIEADKKPTSGGQAGATPELTTPEPPVSPMAASASVVDRALAVLVLHQDWTNTQIAMEVGTHPKYLSSKDCQKFKAARAAIRASSIPSGSKGKDGTIEAIGDDLDFDAMDSQMKNQR